MRVRFAISRFYLPATAPENAACDGRYNLPIDMPVSYRDLRLKLSQFGLWPGSKLALIAWYVLGLDLLLFALQKLFALFRSSFGQGLGGWVGFLSFVAVVLFSVLALRWLKARALW